MTHEIMNMEPGPALDAKIAESLDDASEAWSTNKAVIGDLMERMSCVGEVGILLTDAPEIVCRMAVVGDDGECTTVFTNSFSESLCKAYLLHEQGYYGAFFHPMWETAAKMAPKRIVN